MSLHKENARSIIKKIIFGIFYFLYMFNTNNKLFILLLINVNIILFEIKNIEFIMNIYSSSMEYLIENNINILNNNKNILKKHPLYQLLLSQPEELFSLH